MKHSPAVLATLNKVLTAELTSINQYFLHARMNKNWGYAKLNTAAYKKSILDMKQADDLIERILFLEGLPNLQALGKLMIGETPEETLSCDHQFQNNYVTLLNDAIALCEAEQDFVSRALLVKFLEQEQDYFDWLDTQLGLIQSLSLPKYLQAQLD